MKKRKQKILLIVNPKSGNERTSAIAESMDKVASDYGATWEIFYTTGKNDRKIIGEKLKEFPADILVAAGGDGTINMLLPLLINAELKLGIIPSGSANGLAKNLELPNEPEAALKTILEGKSNPTDLLIINEKHYCIHLSDIGINARIVKRFQQEKSKGLIGYGKQLFKELFDNKSTFKFVLSSRQINRKYKAEMLILANAKAFGTGAIINPKGKMNDGKFEVVVIKPYPWWAIFKLLFTSFTGQLHKMEHVRIHSLKEARIELKKPRELQIDGEVIDNIRRMDIKVLPGSVKLIY